MQSVCLRSRLVSTGLRNRFHLQSSLKRFYIFDFELNESVRSK